VVVLFESPRRTQRLVAQAAEVMPDREACLCRELTKRHEELLRLPLPQLAEELAARTELKGEVVLVIGPGVAPPAAVRAPESTALGAIAAALAERWGVPRREAYQVLLEAERDLSES